MANDLSNNPIVIDTASGSVLISTPIRIRKIRWVGATTAGHTVIIRNSVDIVFWKSVAAGANYVEETDFSNHDSQRNLLFGLKVTVLGSG
jgi:hypothetical protein